jgi:hypothetical protein
MPRKKQKPEPVTSITLKSGAIVEIGGLVSYYLNGWRAGHLEEINGAAIRVRPIGPGHAPKLITVGVDDLKEVI